MREELLKGLTEEQKAKVNACNSSEEILQLAMQEGVELNDDQLEAVSGGGCGDTVKDTVTNIVTAPYEVAKDAYDGIKNN